jgi:hypothetical protein
MRFTDWEPGRSYEGEPIIRWNMEWKVFVKNREQPGESELDLVISPRKFWKHVIRLKVANSTANKPWKKAVTKLVLSVTDRKTSNITKRFPGSDVDWSLVAKQLREWSKFLKDGKKITVTATFYYLCVDRQIWQKGGNSQPRSRAGSQNGWSRPRGMHQEGICSHALPRAAVYKRGPLLEVERGVVHEYGGSWLWVSTTERQKPFEEALDYLDVRIFVEIV